MNSPSDNATTGGEEALVAARRSKAERLRQRGENPFANDVDTSDRSSIAEVRAHFASALLEPPAELRYDAALAERLSGEPRWHLLGRLVARRGFGKLTFLVLRDSTGELQIFAKQDALGVHFGRLDEIDMADFIEASGRIMVTKKGELSLEANEIRLVTKAFRPLPDKWHGLSDIDLRYRRRYVDLIANPDVSAVLRARSFIVSALREFLDDDGFIEVETPSLHSLVGGAAARPFVTHHNALDLELFLRIAPELYLKRLLVGGFERVYEIGRCYRNEGISTRHNPEFTMLEFYQAYATYATLMPMTERMLRHVDNALGERLERAGFGDYYDRWRSERPYTLEEPFARIAMESALAHALEKANLPADVNDRLAELGVSPGPAGEQTSNPAADGWVEEWRGRSERARAIDWRNLRSGLGACDSDGERLFVAYEYVAEPFLADDYKSADGKKSVPVFIMDYPAATSPLARRKDTNPAVVDRFELFVHGRELCNAFSELNDPDDQAARFRDQVDKKRRGAAETMDYDADYIMALEHGMPPAAGFGLGIDRLVMVLAGQPSIRDVIAFPLLRPEAGQP